MSLKERSIPVFIYPNELSFYLAAQSTHKQLLTLYNPYDFPVKYQVYANTKDRYEVLDPKGSIAPHSYIDLVVRHIFPSVANCHSRDKFMITMLDATTNQLLGKRCVLATLLPGERDVSVSDDSSHSYSACEPSLNRERTRTNDIAPSVRTYCIIISVFLIAALMLPTSCDAPANVSVPDYLHIGVPVKIIVGFVLGLITMTLLRPC